MTESGSKFKIDLRWVTDQLKSLKKVESQVELKATSANK